MVFLAVTTAFLVAVTFGLALAHALEFPGKARLDESTYRAVQAIYYPGFTVGGLVGEFGALVSLPVLLLLTPAGTTHFWWTAAALGFLLAAHLTYWFFTHPVNSAWLKDTNLSDVGGLFFSAFTRDESNWRHMRNLWEFSHIVRAVLVAMSLVSITVALV